MLTNHLLSWNLFILLISMLTGSQTGSVISSVKPTVHIFLNTECPVSQQYLPQLARLHQQFNPAGVAFIAHFPLRTDSAATVRQFQQTYAIPYVCMSDTNARIAQRFRVQVTPEVVVTDLNGKIYYQGAIDNWYVDLGQHRKTATEQYLHNALDALLNGRLVNPVRTEAVGCLVEY